MLFAEHVFPDAIDLTIAAFVGIIVIGLPVAGYVFMCVDYMAWLRALRGALVLVVEVIPGVPNWAHKKTPRCLRLLGLEMPCSESDVKRAYHQLAELHHPARGGCPRRFSQLRETYQTAID